MRTVPSFSAGAPKVLFDGAYEVVEGARNYDVAPDGKRFIMIRRDPAEVPQRFYVVSSWLQDLKSREDGR